MDVTKPYELIGFGAMDVTKPYELLGFWAMDFTKPYELIGFGAIDVTKPYELIGFGAMGGGAWGAKKIGYLKVSDRRRNTPKSVIFGPNWGADRAQKPYTYVLFWVPEGSLAGFVWVRV